MNEVTEIRDNVGDTIEESSSIFSLVWVC